jgi:AcrR family transcriptional regulator
MERREELLRAAARVYAQHGYRGSTTRRIADEAGVNEITIFRQFGTKDALIHEAIATCGGDAPAPSLPAAPADPVAELTQWALKLRAHISGTRMLLRRCMSERDEHPQLIASANQGPIRAARDLRGYLERLRERGLVDEAFDARTAASMLIGSIFADAMGRDMMPEVYPGAHAPAVEQYVRFLLRGIGAEVTHAQHADS